MQHVERAGVHSGDSISVYPTFSVSEQAKQTIIDYTVRLGVGIGIVGLYNIQFIVDPADRVYVIEVNPRSSRTVPFLSKATGVPLAIGTRVMLGSLREQGITRVVAPEKKRWYVKAPAFSFSKLRGMDAYLSPEMKSTGEAIGYDSTLNRALYKAMLSSGMNVANYGTIFVTIADRDKDEALPLIQRFYKLGFNIEATHGTAEFLREHGIRTLVRRKLSEGSEEILDSLRQGHVNYVINTKNPGQDSHETDGAIIRRCAVENNVTMFTALDTVKVLLDVLEESRLAVSTIGGSERLISYPDWKNTRLDEKALRRMSLSGDAPPDSRPGQFGRYGCRGSTCAGRSACATGGPPRRAASRWCTKPSAAAPRP